MKSDWEDSLASCSRCRGGGCLVCLLWTMLAITLSSSRAP